MNQNSTFDELDEYLLCLAHLSGTESTGFPSICSADLSRETDFTNCGPAMRRLRAAILLHAVRSPSEVIPRLVRALQLCPFGTAAACAAPTKHLPEQQELISRSPLNRQQTNDAESALLLLLADAVSAVFGDRSPTELAVTFGANSIVPDSTVLEIARRLQPAVPGPVREASAALLGVLARVPVGAASAATVVHTVIALAPVGVVLKREKVQRSAALIIDACRLLPLTTAFDGGAAATMLLRHIASIATVANRGILRRAVGHATTGVVTSITRNGVDPQAMVAIWEVCGPLLQALQTWSAKQERHADFCLEALASLGGLATGQVGVAEDAAGRALSVFHEMVRCIHSSKDEVSRARLMSAVATFARAISATSVSLDEKQTLIDDFVTTCVLRAPQFPYAISEMECLAQTLSAFIAVEAGATAFTHLVNFIQSAVTIEHYTGRAAVAAAAAAAAFGPGQTAPPTVKFTGDAKLLVVAVEAIGTALTDPRCAAGAYRLLGDPAPAGCNVGGTNSCTTTQLTAAQSLFSVLEPIYYLPTSVHVFGSFAPAESVMRTHASLLIPALRLIPHIRPFALQLQSTVSGAPFTAWVSAMLSQHAHSPVSPIASAAAAAQLGLVGPMPMASTAAPLPATYLAPALAQVARRIGCSDAERDGGMVGARACADACLIIDTYARTVRMTVARGDTHVHPDPEEYRSARQLLEGACLARLFTSPTLRTEALRTLRKLQTPELRAIEWRGIMQLSQEAARAFIAGDPAPAAAPTPDPAIYNDGCTPLDAMMLSASASCAAAAAGALAEVVADLLPVIGPGELESFSGLRSPAALAAVGRSAHDAAELDKRIAATPVEIWAPLMQMPDVVASGVRYAGNQLLTAEESILLTIPGVVSPHVRALTACLRLRDPAARARHGPAIAHAWHLLASYVVPRVHSVADVWAQAVDAARLPRRERELPLAMILARHAHLARIDPAPLAATNMQLAGLMLLSLPAEGYGASFPPARPSTDPMTYVVLHRDPGNYTVGGGEDDGSRSARPAQTRQRRRSSVLHKVMNFDVETDTATIYDVNTFAEIPAPSATPTPHQSSESSDYPPASSVAATAAPVHVHLDLDLETYARGNPTTAPAYIIDSEDEFGSACGEYDGTDDALAAPSVAVSARSVRSAAHSTRDSTAHGHTMGVTGPRISTQHRALSDALVRFADNFTRFWTPTTVPTTQPATTITDDELRLAADILARLVWTPCTQVADWVTHNALPLLPPESHFIYISVIISYSVHMCTPATRAHDTSYIAQRRMAYLPQVLALVSGGLGIVHPAVAVAPAQHTTAGQQVAAYVEAMLGAGVTLAYYASEALVALTLSLTSEYMSVFCPLMPSTIQMQAVASTLSQSTETMFAREIAPFVSWAGVRAARPVAATGALGPRAAAELVPFWPTTLAGDPTPAKRRMMLNVIRAALTELTPETHSWGTAARTVLEAVAGAAEARQIPTPGDAANAAVHAYATAGGFITGTVRLPNIAPAELTPTTVVGPDYVAPCAGARAIITILQIHAASEAALGQVAPLEPTDATVDTAYNYTLPPYPQSTLTSASARPSLTPLPALDVAAAQALAPALLVSRPGTLTEPAFLATLFARLARRGPHMVDDLSTVMAAAFVAAPAPLAGVARLAYPVAAEAVPTLVSAAAAVRQTIFDCAASGPAAARPQALLTAVVGGHSFAAPDFTSALSRLRPAAPPLPAPCALDIGTQDVPCTVACLSAGMALASVMELVPAVTLAPAHISGLPSLSDINQAGLEITASTPALAVAPGCVVTTIEQAVTLSLSIITPAAQVFAETLRDSVHTQEFLACPPPMPAAPPVGAPTTFSAVVGPAVNRDGVVMVEVSGRGGAMCEQPSGEMVARFLAAAVAVGAACSGSPDSFAQVEDGSSNMTYKEMSAPTIADKLVRGICAAIGLPPPPPHSTPAAAAACAAASYHDVARELVSFAPLTGTATARTSRAVLAGAALPAVDATTARSLVQPTIIMLKTLRTGDAAAATAAGAAALVDGLTQATGAENVVALVSLAVVGLITSLIGATGEVTEVVGDIVAGADIFKLFVDAAAPGACATAVCTLLQLMPTTPARDELLRTAQTAAAAQAAAAPPPVRAPRDPAQTELAVVPLLSLLADTLERSDELRDLLICESLTRYEGVGAALHVHLPPGPSTDHRSTTNTAVTPAAAVFAACVGSTHQADATAVLALTTPALADTVHAVALEAGNVGLFMLAPARTAREMMVLLSWLVSALVTIGAISPDSPLASGAVPPTAPPPSETIQQILRMVLHALNDISADALAEVTGQVARVAAHLLAASTEQAVLTGAVVAHALLTTAAATDLGHASLDAAAVDATVEGAAPHLLAAALAVGAELAQASTAQLASVAPALSTISGGLGPEDFAAPLALLRAVMYSPIANEVAVVSSFIVAADAAAGDTLSYPAAATTLLPALLVTAEYLITDASPTTTAAAAKIASIASSAASLLSPVAAAAFEHGAGASPTDAPDCAAAMAADLAWALVGAAPAPEDAVNALLVFAAAAVASPAQPAAGAAAAVGAATAAVAAVGIVAAVQRAGLDACCHPAAATLASVARRRHRARNSQMMRLALQATALAGQTPSAGLPPEQLPLRAVGWTAVAGVAARMQVAQKLSAGAAAAVAMLKAPIREMMPLYNLDTIVGLEGQN